MRFFIHEDPVDNQFILSGADAHHASNVLRLQKGDAVTLCNGRGTDYLCTIEEIQKYTLRCHVRDAQPTQSEPKQQITLFMALPKGGKMDLIVQKAVELGVSRIVPYLSCHCVSQPGQPAKKIERWRKIAIEAAKQCERGIVPTVGNIIPVKAALQQAAESETALFCYENERKTGLRERLNAGAVGTTVSIVIGPEGGFSPEEAAFAQSIGLSSVSLGTRVLRCETAAIAALSVLLYAGGNM